MHRINNLKDLIKPLRLSMYNFTEDGVRKNLDSLFHEEAIIHLSHPFGDISGSTNFYNQALQPLFESLPDLERRDYIVIAGKTERDIEWVGCAGFYNGTFLKPFLDIPPTGHIAHMRFHEFYCFQGDKIIEVQALWDIPELMMQSDSWPMAPSLGREWCVPGPATMDGISDKPYDLEKSNSSMEHILGMADAMKKHPSMGGPEIMKMDYYWHPKMNWYGPSAIGSGRGIEGFRNWHQIPFLNAMPDRGKDTTFTNKGGSGDKVDFHFFGDGDYVAVTGWPNMKQTLTHDGWMGIAPNNKEVVLRSLDFWRLEEGKIRENWVMIDILDIYDQMGVDVLGRVREFNKARNIKVH